MSTIQILKDARLQQVRVTRNHHCRTLITILEDHPTHRSFDRDSLYGVQALQGTRL